MGVLILNEAEVERLLNIDELLDALSDGYKALSSGRVSAPPRSKVTSSSSFVLTMPAYVPGHSISVKLVSTYLGTPTVENPSHQAVICLLNSCTGAVEAIMGGTYITAIRTAGASVLSAKLLARGNASTVAIIGAGVQGAAHLSAFKNFEGVKEFRIASRNYSNAQKLALQDSRAVAINSIQNAVNSADVVCLCTTSSQPVVDLNWLKQGAHIASVGHSSFGGELSSEIITNCHLFVESRLAFEPSPIGCGELQGFSHEIGTELGELLLSLRPGRQSDEEITVYKSMGHAMEDAVAANLVYQNARKADLGITLSL